MTYKLVKYKSNWADEMDIFGFHVMTDSVFARWKNAWENSSKKKAHGPFM